MRLTTKTLAHIKTYFTQKPVIKAYLFGSYARGEASTDSDIDILLELDYNQKIGLTFFQMKIDLQEILGKNVDLVTSNSVSKYIKPSIDKEKQLIYAR